VVGILYCWLRRHTLVNGALVYLVLLGNLEEGSYAKGLCVEEVSGSDISPYRDHVGEPWEGVRLLGILKIN